MDSSCTNLKGIRTMIPFDFLVKSQRNNIFDNAVEAWDETRIFFGKRGEFDLSIFRIVQDRCVDGIVVHGVSNILRSELFARCI